MTGTTPPAEGAPAGPFDARMRRALVTVAGTGVALSAGTLAIAGFTTASSVFMGAAVATGNLWALARILAAILPTDDRTARSQSRAAWAMVGVLKTFGLVVVLWLLIRHGVVSPLPMVLGYGALPIGIAIGSLVSDRNAPLEDRP